MRVTLLAPLVTPLVAAQLGGAQAVLCDLARGLAEAGEEVELIAARGSRVPGVRLRHVAAPFTDAQHRFSWRPAVARHPPGTSPRPRQGRTAGRAPAGWPPLQAGAYARALAAIDRRKPSVIHAHAHDWPAFYAAATAGLPALHTLHVGPEDPAAVEAARVAATCRPRPLFVAVSRSCRSRWARLVPVDAVVPNGADPRDIPFSPRPVPGTALIAGRIAPEKGTHLAVAACRRAGVRALVAGAVYDRGYYEQRVRPEVERGSAEYLGPLPRRRLARVYGRCSVAVVASLWEEPFGMVALEANLAGTPVAAFPNGALPEVVGKAGGVISADRTVRSLAAAVAAAAVLDRAAVSATAARRFPLRAMVDAYRSLYRVALREDHLR